MAPKTNAEIGERVAQLETKIDSVIPRLESVATKLEAVAEKSTEFRGRILGALAVVAVFVPLATAVALKAIK